jgi:hypothetical protein
MSVLDSIKDVLNSLEKDGLLLDSKFGKRFVIINGITFFLESKLNNHQKNSGLILTESTKLIRQNLQKKEISYIDTDGNIFIKSELRNILIEKSFISKSKNKKPQAEVKLNPTNVISPNGLDFIDVLFRIDDREIAKFNSALHFCKHYKLYQPKVSQIMHRLKVKNLADCKKKLKEFSLDWWIFALENPASKRKMTPFFKTAQNYYSIDEKINKIDTVEIFKKLHREFQNNIAPGPSEVSKSFGELVDDGINIWVSPLIAKKLKKDFKLVPGFKSGQKNWLITVSGSDLESEKLISKDKKTNPPTTNIMRAIWDLGFGDYRQQEARTNILRKFLNGI